MQNETKLEIYYKRDNTLERELRVLKTWKTSHINKELITRFKNYLLSTTSKQLRVSKLVSQLRRMVLVLKKDLDKVTKQDIQDLISFYNQIPTYSEATKSDYRRTTKQFYRWFEDEDTRLNSKNELERLETQKLYRFIEKEITTAYKKPKADPKTIVTDEDIDLVLEVGCTTIKEKAFIKFLHECGVRAEEMLNIKIADVQINNNYATVRVDGKTGERNIPIVTSLPLIIRYLELHPYRNDKYSYLWLGDNRRCLHKPFKHAGSQKLIDRCFKRAGLSNKKHNLHWFRHSRATLLAPHLTESILCKYMGWSIGSRQIKTYCHLNNKQVTDAILNVKGIIDVKEQEYKDKPIKCICDTINEPNARYCYKCGKPLSIEIAIQGKESMDDEINKTMQFMMEMAKKPELMKKFFEFRESYLKNKY